MALRPGPRERRLALDVAAGPDLGPRVQDPPAQRAPASDPGGQGPGEPGGGERRRPGPVGGPRRLGDRKRLQRRPAGLDARPRVWARPRSRARGAREPHAGLPPLGLQEAEARAARGPARGVEEGRAARESQVQLRRETRALRPLHREARADLRPGPARAPLRARARRRRRPWIPSRALAARRYDPHTPASPSATPTPSYYLLPLLDGCLPFLVSLSRLMM
jgi:hypothetical protein